MGNSPKKSALETYAEIAATHSRVQAVAAAIPFEVKFRDFPGPPQSPADLREAVDVLRENLVETNRAIHAWDRSRNGCEVRTIAMIETDIETDERLLQQGMPDPFGRDEETIRNNIAYDKMQLERSKFYR